MSETFEIKAQTRSERGRGASRRLRKSGRVPAIVYGGQAEPVMISVEQSELNKHLDHEAFYSHILQLNLNGTVEDVVLKDLHRHPARPLILHMDLQRVNADRQIRMLVPIHFINEDKCPGIKKGGTATRSLTEVEVNCLPKDLPEFISVDMISLEINHTVHIKDLTLPKDVEFSHGLDPNMPIVSIHAARSGTDAEDDAAENKA